MLTPKTRAELYRLLFAGAALVAMLWAAGLFKVDIAGCERRVLAGIEGFEQMVPEHQSAYRGLAQEACEGMAADGIVRK